jgi:hypothetical protein
MKCPPPIPIDWGLTTPLHSEVVIAASTTCPPFSKACLLKLKMLMSLYVKFALSKI